MVWLPHTDILNVDDFCPAQFYMVMAVHALSIFVGVMLGFWMGYRATSKILAESWEMYVDTPCLHLLRLLLEILTQTAHLQNELLPLVCAISLNRTL